LVKNKYVYTLLKIKIMKKISKLEICRLKNELSPLSEDQLRKIMGGWYCFLNCLDYLGMSGSMYGYYYNNLYGSMESSGGVSSSYLEATLGYCGFDYYNPPLDNAVGSIAQIKVVDPTTNQFVYHAVICTNCETKSFTSGLVTQISYYDPTFNTYGLYVYGASEEISMVGFH
jgi:hypothetical protein